MMDMSNFDHSIDDGMEDFLKESPGKYVGEHSARDFFGTVMWDDGQFVELVHKYGSIVDTVKAPTLRELMEKVNDKHGWE